MQVEIVNSKGKQVVDTKKMSKGQAKLTELVENSMLRQWAHENKGACFVWGHKDGTESKKGLGWTTFYLKNILDYVSLINSVDVLLSQASHGKLGVRIMQIVEPTTAPTKPTTSAPEKG
jgi:hypothetical protein